MKYKCACLDLLTYARDIICLWFHLGSSICQNLQSLGQLVEELRYKRGERQLCLHINRTLMSSFAGIFKNQIKYNDAPSPYVISYTSVHSNPIIRLCITQSPHYCSP